MSDVSKFNLFGETINVKDLTARNFISTQETVNTNTNNKITSLGTSVADVKEDVSKNTTNITSVNGRLSMTNSDVANLTARVDKLSSLPQGSTSGDAELQDIRIDYKGDTWSNAGDSVRGITDFLNDMCTGLGDTIPLSWSTFEDLNVAYARLTNNGDVYTRTDKLYVRFATFNCVNNGMIIKNSYPDFYKIRVAKYSSSSLNSSTFVGMVSNPSEYEHSNFYALEKGYYYSVSVTRNDEQEFTDTTLLNLKRNLTKGVKSVSENDVAVVGNYNELVNALNNGTKFVFVNNDFNITAKITITNDVVIYGNHKVLTGNESIQYMFYISAGANVVFNDLVMNYSKDTIVRIAGNGVFNNCEVYHSVENDGIAPIENANVYIYNCKVHDNYDEGVSTHNNSYCEVIGGEFYRNGYVYGTSTAGAPSSYGGVHLGGGRMGVVKNVYSHNNRTYGIGLIRFQGMELTDTEICIGNTVMNNGSDGIKVTACRDLILNDNKCSFNGGYGIHFGDETGFPSGESFASTGYVMYNEINNNVHNEILIDENADDGVDLYNNVLPKESTYQSKRIESTSVPSGSWTTLNSLELKGGHKYLLEFYVSRSSGSGGCSIGITPYSTGTPAVNHQQYSSVAYCSRMYLLDVTEDTTYYLKIIQSSGSTANWNGYGKSIQIE